MAKKEKKEKKAKKEKKEKVGKKAKRARREKRQKPKERQFAYDRAISTLGGVVCAFAILIILAIILTIVYGFLH